MRKAAARVLKVVLLLVPLLLSGCWDRRMLKDLRLTHATGMELLDDERVELIIALQREGKDGAGNTPVLTEAGRTVREARVSMNRLVSGQINTSHNRIVLIGESLARKDAYAPLDVIYRDPLNPLSIPVAVAVEKVSDIFMTELKDAPMIGDHLYRILQTAENEGALPFVTIQDFCVAMFDTGEDPVLPIIELVKEKQNVKAAGLALFHNTKMTGRLNRVQSTMLQLMSGETSASGIAIPFHHTISSMKDYVTINVLDLRRKMTVSVQHSEQIKAVLQLKVTVEVTEMPQSATTVEIMSDKLTEAMQEQLSRSMNETLVKLQEANCDYLGIGKELRGKYPSVWKQLKWDEMYKQIDLTVEPTVLLKEHGIIE